jgi:replicative DNA helicase
MIHCPSTQLTTMILLKLFTRLTGSLENEAIARRMEELDVKQLTDPEHRKLYEEYSSLFDRIEVAADQELRYNALFELDIVIEDKLAETGRFHYLAGLNDAMRVFSVS